MINLSHHADLQPPPDTRVEMVSVIPRTDGGAAPGNLERPASDKATQEAHKKANLCQKFDDMIQNEGISANQAAFCLKKSPSWFSTNVPKWRREGLAAFLPTPRGPSASIIFPDLPEWFIPAAQFFYLLSNRTRYGGSIPEAIRRVIGLPVCPPAVIGRLKKKLGLAELPDCPAALRDAVFARERAGKDLLPESITRQIAASAPFIRQFRNPTDANLEYNCAPGTMMWLTHPDTGEKFFIRPGQVMEIDDATINFPVCVPWTMRGCPCSEKFDVKVGRFQWLVTIDVGSRFITGFSYTARPKSSYRAEDLLSVMRGVGRQWGVPKFWRMEQGVSASKLIVNAVHNMDSTRIGVHSPRNKPFIEIFFNILWTKLSVYFPKSEVGRYAGDTEEAAVNLVACQNGHRDPRQHFPMMSDALKAFGAAIAEYNATMINSPNYGRWVPQDRWQDRIQLKRLNPAHDWIFSPFCREWTVRGASVGGRVPIMDGLSVPYDFSAPWLSHFDGARVKAYFDPAEPRCAATICLDQRWRDYERGKNLGTALQINETTQYVQMAMGWDENPDRTLGLRARKQNATALRREVRTIFGAQSQGSTESRPAGFSESKEHDGISTTVKISSGDCIEPEAAGTTATQENGSRGSSINLTNANAPLRAGAIPETGHNLKRAAELEEFEKQNAHLFL